MSEEGYGHIKYNNNLFKGLVPIYDWVALFLRNVRKDIAKNMELGSNSKVIDVACGTGTQAIKLAKMGYCVVGVDISPDMIGRARNKAEGIDNLIFKLANAAKTGYPNSYFDTAIISFALHDMPCEMRIKVIDELKRIVKPQGNIIISDYAKRSNKVIRRLIYKITKTWESKYYEDFLDKGADYYLQKSNLIASSRKSYFWGEVESLVISERF